MPPPKPTPGGGGGGGGAKGKHRHVKPQPQPKPPAPPPAPLIHLGKGMKLVNRGNQISVVSNPETWKATGMWGKTDKHGNFVGPRPTMA